MDKDTLRGSLFMALAMALFALEDMIIKTVAGAMPTGEVLIVFGFGGMILFALVARARGERLWHPGFCTRPLLWRFVAEVSGRLFFTLAIVLAPLSLASAILQATPLVVTAGAVVFFGERVGWRRWVAIAVGFLGVLMILRPGMSGFEATSLLAVAGMLGFAGRDLATRAAPPVLSNMQLGVYGFFVLIPTGFALLIYSGEAVSFDPGASIQILGSIVFGVIAYNALTIAMRTGDVSVVTPFRYTRLIFALILGIFVFGERPDLMTLMGGVLIVVSGGYTLLRNRRIIRSAA